MAIFKKENSDKSKDKLVGGYVSPQVHSLLSLHCIASGITKSAMLVKLIDKHIIDDKLDSSVLGMYETIALKALVGYTPSKRNTIESYAVKVAAELSRNGIHQEHINQIVTYIIRIHNEQPIKK